MNHVKNKKLLAEFSKTAHSVLALWNECKHCFIFAHINQKLRILQTRSWALIMTIQLLCILVSWIILCSSKKCFPCLLKNIALFQSFTKSAKHLKMLILLSKKLQCIFILSMCTISLGLLTFLDNVCQANSCKMLSK